MVAGGLVTAACASHPGTTQPRTAAILGSAPLCEASGATRAPWDRDLILIVDNEDPDSVFGFRVGDDGLFGQQTEIPIAGTSHPQDGEALATVDDQVVIIGSHGRNRWCERRRAKERVMFTRWNASSESLEPVSSRDDTVLVDRALASVDDCLEALFVMPRPAFAKALCRSIVAAENTLERQRCVPPLDFEAAAALPSPDGPRIWIGLRRPRVNGHPAMVRVATSFDGPLFDGVALLDMTDRGMRAMGVDDGHLWVVLGPGSPDYATSSLWTTAAAAVRPGATLRGRIAADRLPPASEGLVIDGDGAIVVVDGDESPSGEGPCLRPARQLRLALD